MFEQKPKIDELKQELEKKSDSPYPLRRFFADRLAKDLEREMIGPPHLTQEDIDRGDAKSRAAGVFELSLEKDSVQQYNTIDMGRAEKAMAQTDQAMSEMGMQALIAARGFVKFTGTTRFEFGGLHCNNSVMSNEQIKTLWEVANQMKLDADTREFMVKKASEISGSSIVSFSLLFSMLDALKSPDQWVQKSPEAIIAALAGTSQETVEALIRGHQMKYGPEWILDAEAGTIKFTEKGMAARKAMGHPPKPEKQKPRRNKRQSKRKKGKNKTVFR